MTAGLAGASTRRSSEREFSYHKIEDLHPHPLNAQIYGEESLDHDLVESIKTNGMLQPILFARMSFNDGGSYENYIVSGHRRWLAAKKLAWEKVPTIDFTWADARSFKNPQPQLLVERRLVESNRARVKTESQKDAEAAALLRIESELAKERLKQGRQNLADPNTAGKAVDKVAAITGESPETVRKRAAIHEAGVPATERNQLSTNAAFENLPKPTTCDICSAPFESKGAMKSHRKQAHAEEMAQRKPSLPTGGVPVVESTAPPLIADSTSSTPLQNSAPPKDAPPQPPAEDERIAFRPQPRTPNPNYNRAGTRGYKDKPNLNTFLRRLMAIGAVGTTSPFPRVAEDALSECDSEEIAKVVIYNLDYAIRQLKEYRKQFEGLNPDEIKKREDDQKQRELKQKLYILFTEILEVNDDEDVVGHSLEEHLEAARKACTQLNFNLEDGIKVLKGYVWMPSEQTSAVQS